MANDTKVFSFPESDGGNSWLPWVMNNNGGGLFGNNGLGGGILGFLLGLAFGNGGLFGNWGGGFNGNGGGAGFLSNQISNSDGRDLLMQAITSQGEQSRAAINALSTMIGQDFNLVNSGVQTIQTAINQIGNSLGMSSLQVINAIQAGNASLASQLSTCCCQMQQSIAAKAAADQLANCQQTYTLTDAMNKNYLALDNKIDALESSRKDRELAAANARIATLESQNFTTGVVQAAVTPIINQLNALGAQVDAIKRCQPSTITLPNNSMTAVPTIWANAVADNIVDKISTALTPTTTTTTTPAA